MAVEPGEEPKGEEEGEVLELQPEQIVPEGEEGIEPPPTPEGGEDEEVLVSFGGEPAPGSDGDAPEWVRELRRRNRELERKVAEFEKSGAASTVPEAGPKPTLAGCDYDEERFEQELSDWNDRKAKADRAAGEAEAAAKKAEEAFNAKVGAYGQQKDKLQARDFDTAEAEVLSALSQTQQGLIIHGAERKAELVLALGRHPDKLRELATITDPVEFAFAAGRLEGKLTVSTKRPATSPEGKVTGSAPLSGTSDKTLERLEAEAAKTGDRSKVIAHTRQQQLRART